MSLNHLPTTERLIVNRLINEAVQERRLCVSVFDEEDLVLNRSDSVSSIRKAIGHTDMTIIKLYQSMNDELPAGTFQLIHGNGSDVIADYSANELCDYLFEFSTEHVL